MRGINGACMEEYAKLQIEKLPSWQSNYAHAGDPSSNSYPVTGVTFDAICEDRNIDRIHFLKMNIEDADWVALRGCRLALHRTRHVCLATHYYQASKGDAEHFLTH